MINKYDYLVVNDSIHEAANKIHTIVEAEHMKATRNLDLIEKIKKERF